MTPIQGENILNDFYLLMSKSIPRDTGGYDTYLKIITELGEEFAGRVYEFSKEGIGIRVPVLKMQNISECQKNEKWFFWKNIHSFAIQDRSYAPKLAHDWMHRGPHDNPWLIKINKSTSKETEKIGVIKNIQEKVGNLISFPISFTLQIHPNKNLFCPYYVLNNISSIRFLSSGEAYQLDKSGKIEAVNTVLQLTFPQVLVSLVCEYISGDFPEDVPTYCYEFFEKGKKGTKRKERD